ncbi:MAG TPA: hypothetical protein VH021_04440 [Trebonia sp.]|nr:hypothetical protein [Trebonia sp.]
MSSLIGRGFPAGGHAVSTRGRPGGTMSSAQVRGTSARHLDDEEKA